jgi:hypothetical protein
MFGDSVMRHVLISVVVLFLAGCTQKPPAGGGGAVDLSTVRPQAEAMSKAVLDRDHETLADYTHPRIVEAAGGRNKLIERVRQMMKEMDESGFQMVANEVGDPGEPVVEGGTAYVILPTTLRLKGPKVRGVAESYLLGISTDGGKTWRFADGAGLSKPEERKRVFPDLPVDLHLPEKKLPVFEDAKD